MNTLDILVKISLIHLALTPTLKEKIRIVREKSNKEIDKKNFLKILCLQRLNMLH